MRFAVISHEGTSLSMWLRLQDEGNEVMVWIAPRHARKIGLGLVSVIGSFEALAAWGMERQDTVFIFDCTDHGDKADWLRKRGHLVFGGGIFCDKLEGQRAWGEQIAKDAGLITPETIEHSSIAQSIKWLSKHDDGRGWYFKPNKDLGSDTTQGKSDVEKMVRYLEYMQRKVGDRVPHILQEKLDGVDISTACYWNGKAWVGPFECTVEHKKFMEGDKGPSTGCCFNVVGFYGDDMFPKIVEELRWHELTDSFRRFEAPAGLYDINALVCKKDGRARFLEWTPRFGYDSEPTAWRALTEPMGETFYKLATGRISEMPFDCSENQMSVRLSVSPYPWEEIEDMPTKRSCVGVPINGLDGLWDGLFVAYGVGLDDETPDQIIMQDKSGLLGLVATSGTDLESMNEELMDFCKDELEVSGLQYRSDAAKTLGAHIDELRELGYDVPLVVTPEKE